MKFLTLLKCSHPIPFPIFMQIIIMTAPIMSLYLLLNIVSKIVCEIFSFPVTSKSLEIIGLSRFIVFLD